MPSSSSSACAMPACPSSLWWSTWSFWSRATRRRRPARNFLRQGDEIRERIAGLERALARLEYKIEHYDEVMTATERTLRAGE